MAVIVKLLSKFDNSGLKAAQRGFSGLSKTLGAVGIGLGLSQVSKVLMDSAKAAQDDIKSQSLLATALKRNTGATDAQILSNEKYIASLSRTVGVSDDILRPALADLTRSTKDVGKAQELLTISFDAAAIKGKSVTSVETAIAKAYNGSTSALSRMFPELKKVQVDYEKTNGKVKKLADSTKLGALMIKALAKESKGAAAEQATPFDKMNVAMDEMKEKLGNVVLPIITDFITQMMKPGGAIDQVGKFLDDVSNPKTEAGKTFLDIKKAVGETIGAVKDFFALFGNGDAMKGFANIASSLIKMLPALLVLKSIMMLASAGKAIQSLVTAMTLIQGKGVVGDVVGGGGRKSGTGKLLGTGALLGLGMVLSTSGDTMIRPDKVFDPNYNPKTGGPKTQPANPSFVINVNAADPKATVDALGKYLKQNGSLPFNLATAGRG